MGYVINEWGELIKRKKCLIGKDRASAKRYCSFKEKGKEAQIERKKEKRYIRIIRKENW